MKIIRSAPRLTSVIVDIISLKNEGIKRNPENYINIPEKYRLYLWKFKTTVDQLKFF
jgi:hypothetical protein